MLQGGKGGDQRTQVRSSGVPLSSQGVAETAISLAVHLNRVLQGALERIEPLAESIDCAHRGICAWQPAELRQEGSEVVSRAGDRRGRGRRRRPR